VRDTLGAPWTKGKKKRKKEKERERERGRVREGQKGGSENIPGYL